MISNIQEFDPIIILFQEGWNYSPFSISLRKEVLECLCLQPGITAEPAKFWYLPSPGMNFHPSSNNWTYQLTWWGGGEGREEIISDIAALSGYSWIYCHRNCSRSTMQRCSWGTGGGKGRLWGELSWGYIFLSRSLIEILAGGSPPNGGDNLSLIPHNLTITQNDVAVLLPFFLQSYWSRERGGTHSFLQRLELLFSFQI